MYAQQDTVQRILPVDSYHFQTGTDIPSEFIVARSTTKNSRNQTYSNIPENRTIESQDTSVPIAGETGTQSSSGGFSDDEIPDENGLTFTKSWAGWAEEQEEMIDYLETRLPPIVDSNIFAACLNKYHPYVKALKEAEGGLGYTPKPMGWNGERYCYAREDLIGWLRYVVIKDCFITLP